MEEAESNAHFWKAVELLCSVYEWFLPSIRIKRALKRRGFQTEKCVCKSVCVRQCNEDRSQQRGTQQVWETAESWWKLQLYSDALISSDGLLKVAEELTRNRETNQEGQQKLKFNPRPEQYSTNFVTFKGEIFSPRLGHRSECHWEIEQHRRWPKGGVKGQHLCCSVSPIVFTFWDKVASF